MVVLCATDSNNHPAEAWLSPISPAYGLINELSPAPYLSAPGADVFHRNVLGRDNPAPGEHDPIEVIPSDQGYLWKKTLTAYGMGHCWSVPNIPHQGWILENIRLDLSIFIKCEIPIPHAANTGWICVTVRDRKQLHTHCQVEMRKRRVVYYDLGFK